MNPSMIMYFITLLCAAMGDTQLQDPSLQNVKHKEAIWCMQLKVAINLKKDAVCACMRADAPITIVKHSAGAILHVTANDDTVFSSGIDASHSNLITIIEEWENAPTEADLDNQVARLLGALTFTGQFDPNLENYHERFCAMKLFFTGKLVKVYFLDGKFTEDELLSLYRPRIAPPDAKAQPPPEAPPEAKADPPPEAPPDAKNEPTPEAPPEAKAEPPPEAKAEATPEAPPEAFAERPDTTSAGRTKTTVEEEDRAKKLKGMEYKVGTDFTGELPWEEEWVPIICNNMNCTVWRAPVKGVIKHFFDSYAYQRYFYDIQGNTHGGTYGGTQSTSSLWNYLPNVLGMLEERLSRAFVTLLMALMMPFTVLVLMFKGVLSDVLCPRYCKTYRNMQGVAWMFVIYVLLANSSNFIVNNLTVVADCLALIALGVALRVVLPFLHSFFRRLFAYRWYKKLKYKLKDYCTDFDGNRTRLVWHIWWENVTGHCLDRPAVLD